MRLEHPRPVIGGLHESGSHRIIPDVGGFFLEALAATQAVLEKVPLPVDPAVLRRPPLPACYRALYPMPLGRKRNKRMQVVRHEQKKPDEPLSGHVPERHALDECLGYFRNAELVAPTFPAVERQEIYLLPGINPVRHFVRQCLALRKKWRNPIHPNPAFQTRSPVASQISAENKW